MALDYVLGEILSNNLQRTANLSFNSTLLYLDVISNRIGINTPTPIAALDVNGDARISGNVTVANITIGNIVIPSVGDISFNGAVLSNIGAPVSNTDATNKQYVDQYLSKIANSNLIISNTTIGTPFTSGNITLVPTGIGQVYIVGSGILSAQAIYSSTLNSTGNLIAGNANIAGNVVANVYYGDGGKLSNINIGNVLLSNISTDVIPSVNNLYNLGNSVRQWKEVWVKNGIYIDSVPLQSSSGSFFYDGRKVVVENSVGTATVNSLYCINSLNAGYFIGDGSNLSNIQYNSIVGAYSNANTQSFVSTYLPVYSGNILANNVTASYFIGDGSNINNIRYSSIIGAYSNANVANYLPTFLPYYTDNITANNITASYLIGDGSNISNIQYNDIVNAYSNANVANYIPTYLPSYAGDILAYNVTASYFYGDGGNLTNVGTTIDFLNVSSDIIPSSNSLYSLGNTTNQWKELWVSNSTIYLGGIPLSTSNTGTLLVDEKPVLFENSTDTLNVGPVNSEGDVTTTGFFIGDGSQLTNLPAGNYSNANVANYLPIYAGDISATNIVADSIQVGPSFTQSFATSSSNLDPVILAEFDVGLYHSFTFNVTAVDSIGNSCEVMKIIAATVNGLVEYTEYGSITIGNSVASFSVTMNSSNIVLQAAPDTSNTVNYSVMVNNYS